MALLRGAPNYLSAKPPIEIQGSKIYLGDLREIAHRYPNAVKLLISLHNEEIHDLCCRPKALYVVKEGLIFTVNSGIKTNFAGPQNLKYKYTHTVNGPSVVSAKTLPMVDSYPLMVGITRMFGGEELVGLYPVRAIGPLCYTNGDQYNVYPTFLHLTVNID